MNSFVLVDYLLSNLLDQRGQVACPCAPVNKKWAACYSSSMADRAGTRLSKMVGNGHEVCVDTTWLCDDERDDRWLKE
jgi:hypothetical protein